MKGSQISRPAMGFFCSSNHGDCCCFGGHQKTSWGRCLHQFQIENAIAFWVHHTVLSRCLAVSLAHWKLSIPDIRLNSSIWNIRTQFVQALSGNRWFWEWSETIQQSNLVLEATKWMDLWIIQGGDFKVKTQKVFQVTVFSSRKAPSLLTFFYITAIYLRKRALPGFSFRLWSFNLSDLG